MGTQSLFSQKCGDKSSNFCTDNKWLIFYTIYEMEVGEPQAGDKVLVLAGENAGERGIIAEVLEELVVVSFGERTGIFASDSLKNFSAAARKAWRTHPQRGAGRPKNPNLPEKRMVSLRIDKEIWDGLGDAAEKGLIWSREAAVNDWLREKLLDLRTRYQSFVQTWE
jgi:hypothetical protein